MGKGRLHMHPSRSNGYQSFGGHNLVAYRVASVSGGGVLTRGDWNPLILFVLLGVLVLVVSVQIIVIYTYGGSNADFSYAAFYSGPGYNGFGASGGLFARWALASPPPRINLYSLLDRNVPSIAANKRKLYEKMNAGRVNSILDNAQRNITSVKKPSTSTATSDLKDCSPNTFYGQILPNISHSHAGRYTEKWILSQVPELEPGGTWKPKGCLPTHSVAIIIPYRDRKNHLKILLAHLHPILQRQMLHYRIYVVEQYGNNTFNKARIMNIAFVTALQQNPKWQCFVFHDVDLVPEDDRNMYSCPVQPRHMSPAIDEMNYKIPYDELVGGVFAIRTEHFFLVNGYSNLYWGWGAEDDDMAYRVQHVGLKITRPPSQIARYKMIKHAKRPAVDSRIRYRLLWTGVKRYKIDGLNSLSSLKYTIKHVNNLPLYTHILIDVGTPPPGF